MNDFPNHYRAIIGPRIRQAAIWRGVLVACGDETYGEAVSEVWWEAWRLGASRLPQRLADDLCSCIGDWICESVEAALPACDEANKRATRVSVELGRYFRAWEAAQ